MSTVQLKHGPEYRAAGIPAESMPGAVFANTADIKWTPFPEGDAQFILLSIDPATGGWTGVLRFPENTDIPMHLHLGAAEAYTISGDWTYLEGDLGAGWYIYEPSGIVHEAATQTAVDMFVVIRGSNVYFDDDGNFESWLDVHMLYTLAKNNGAADHLKHYDDLMVERPLIGSDR